MVQKLRYLSIILGSFLIVFQLKAQDVGKDAVIDKLMFTDMLKIGVLIFVP